MLDFFVSCRTAKKVFEWIVNVHWVPFTTEFGCAILQFTTNKRKMHLQLCWGIQFPTKNDFLCILLFTVNAGVCEKVEVLWKEYCIANFGISEIFVNFVFHFGRNDHFWIEYIQVSTLIINQYLRESISSNFVDDWNIRSVKLVLTDMPIL